MARLDELLMIEGAIKRDDAADVQALLRTYPQHRFLADGQDEWLTSAIMDNRANVVKMLVLLGADPAAPVNPTDSVPQPEGPMKYAAAAGHIEMIHYLLDLGVPVNLAFEGRVRSVPLVMAAGNGRLNVVRLLVERGAAVNPAGSRHTPLDAALMAGRDEVADYLRSAGAKTAAELAPSE